MSNQKVVINIRISWRVIALIAATYEAGRRVSDYIVNVLKKTINIMIAFIHIVLDS